MGPTETAKYLTPSQILIRSMAVYLTVLAICSMMVNITDYKYYNALGYKTVMIFTSSMMFIWTIVLLGIRRSSYKVLGAALIFWTLFLVIWSYITLLNVKDSDGMHCVERRCPNTFWLIAFPFNKTPIDNPFDYYDHKPHEMTHDEYDYDPEIRDYRGSRDDNDTPETTTVTTSLYDDDLTPEPVIAKLRMKQTSPPPPRAEAFRHPRMAAYVTDRTRFLMQAVFITAFFILFLKSWIYLKRIYVNTRYKTLCPKSIRLKNKLKKNNKTATNETNSFVCNATCDCNNI